MIILCQHCKIQKSYDQFPKQKKNKIGVTKTCLACTKNRRPVHDISVDKQMCKQCCVIKYSSEFAKSKYNTDGIRHICRICSKSNKTIKNTLSYFTKICNMCNTTQAMYCFSKHPYAKDGYINICKECKKLSINPEKRKIIKRKSYKKIRSTNIAIRIIDNVRRRTSNFYRNSIRGNKPSYFEEYVSCTSDQLYTWIQSQWEPDMDNSNYGSGKGKWSIDHIIPLDEMKKDPNNKVLLKRLNHWFNLRPMWNSENSAKKNRLDYEKTYF